MHLSPLTGPAMASPLPAGATGGFALPCARGLATPGLDLPACSSQGPAAFSLPWGVGEAGEAGGYPPQSQR